MVYRQVYEETDIREGFFGWRVWLGLGFGQVCRLVVRGLVLMLLVSRRWFGGERGTGGVGCL